MKNLMGGALLAIIASMILNIVGCGGNEEDEKDTIHSYSEYFASHYLSVDWSKVPDTVVPYAEYMINIKSSGELCGDFQTKNGDLIAFYFSSKDEYGVYRQYSFNYAKLYYLNWNKSADVRDFDLKLAFNRDIGSADILLFGYSGSDIVTTSSMYGIRDKDILKKVSDTTVVVEVWGNPSYAPVVFSKSKNLTFYNPFYYEEVKRDTIWSSDRDYGYYDTIKVTVKFGVDERFADKYETLNDYILFRGYIGGWSDVKDIRYNTIVGKNITFSQTYSCKGKQKEDVDFGGTDFSLTIGMLGKNIGLSSGDFKVPRRETPSE